MPDSPDSLLDRPRSKSSQSTSKRSSVRELAGHDVLADVLSSLGLQGRLFCRSELRAPWSLELQSGEFAHFHAIERGGAFLRLEKRRDWLQLDSGDVVVLPHGRGHRLADAPLRSGPPSIALARSSSNSRCRVLTSRGAGPETRMLCGSFRFERRSAHPLIALLPEVIHLRAEQGRAAPWLETTLRFLAEEAREPRPGGETVMTRLIDVLFVQVVRAWLASEPESHAGWLGALRDEKVGAALALMHAEPAKPWTVALLARRVGSSRSPFAARFAAKVGEPPLAYLTRWRMQLASRLLERSEVSTAQVASAVGYESEAAFARAFKRAIGVAPGAFRRSPSSRSVVEAERG